MSTQTTDLTAWLDELTAALRAVLALAEELDAIFGGHDVAFQHGEGYCVALDLVADRIRAAVAAAHTEEGR